MARGPPHPRVSLLFFPSRARIPFFLPKFPKRDHRDCRGINSLGWAAARSKLDGGVKTAAWCEIKTLDSILYVIPSMMI
jgi:hypothetical protein